MSDYDLIAHHTGMSVDIVGIEEGSTGRSCEEHSACGCILGEGSVVRIRRIQIMVDGHEESALGVFWIDDGIDRCLVRFLCRHLVKRHWATYDGRIAQVVEMLKESGSSTKRQKSHKNGGCCRGVLIDTIQYQAPSSIGTTMVGEHDEDDNEDEDEDEEEVGDEEEDDDEEEEEEEHDNDNEDDNDHEEDNEVDDEAVDEVTDSEASTPMVVRVKAAAAKVKAVQADKGRLTRSLVKQQSPRRTTRSGTEDTATKRKKRKY